MKAMNETTGISSLLQLLNPTNTISINRPLAHAIGVPESLIFSALISKYTYYSSRNRVNDGWFFSTVTDLQESTTYGEKTQKSAIKHLAEVGVIETKLMGMPAKRYFRICEDAAEKIAQLLKLGMEKASQIAASAKTRNPAKFQPDDGTSAENASFSSSADMAEQASTMGGTSSADWEEQAPPDGRSKLRRLGGTCSADWEDKSKVNNPKGSNLNINQSYQSSSDCFSQEFSAEQPHDEMDRIEQCKQLVKSNIAYDWFVDGYRAGDYRQRPYGSLEELDGIIDIMTDCICSTAPSIRVSNQQMPQEIVKAQLLKLDSEHIAYVLQCLAQNRTDIRNIKAYLITTLYNAPSTFSNYISASIRHNMPEL